MTYNQIIKKNPLVYSLQELINKYMQFSLMTLSKEINMLLEALSWIFTTLPIEVVQCMYKVETSSFLIMQSSF